MNLKPHVLLFFALLAAFHCSLRYLLLFFASAFSLQAATLTTTILPPEGGSVTGAGTYAVGAKYPLAVQAHPGYYLTNILHIGPKPPLVNGLQPLTAQEVFQRQLIAARLTNSDFDATTITNFSAGISIFADITNTVIFAPLAPVLSQWPTNQVVLAGKNVSLVAQAHGRKPLAYQWYRNGEPVVGAIEPTLTFINLQSVSDGTYVLTVTNAFGVTNTAPVMVAAQDIVVRVNGEMVVGTNFTGLNPISIALESRFANGRIYYTLDGRTPSLSSTRYFSAFTLTTNAVLRAVAYDANLTTSVELSPVTLTVLPTYVLSVFTDVGTVTREPAMPYYPAGTPVTITVTPPGGWTFLGWKGDAAGTNLTQTVVMHRDTYLQATFATPLTTVVEGNGTVEVFPQIGLYPAHRYVPLAAIPAAGYYFDHWSGDITGNFNPSGIYISESFPTVAAVFSPLPAGNVTLIRRTPVGGSIEIDGNEVYHPYYPVGTTVTLEAFGYGFWEDRLPFLRWGGDLSGTNNPLTLTLTSNMVVTAYFDHAPSMEITREEDQRLALRLYEMVWGERYRIEESTNLLHWTPVHTLTNLDDAFSLGLTEPATNSLRFYRTVVGE